MGSSRTFNGYVHHIIPDMSPNKNYVDITLIGASRVFKQQSQKVWTNTTADQVIADIADANNFSYIATPSPRIYDQISQAGMSDWELMVKLAKQNGYSLKADNTTLIFQPLTQDFTDMRQEAAYYAMRGLESKATGIYAFTPMIGEAIPYADATKTTVAISGVDRTSATSHSQTNQGSINHTRSKSSSPIFDAYHTNVVAPTYQIAQYEATAADERNRYAYRGEVTIQGNPTILPDSPIYLDGLGPTYSGYWTALSITHNIKGNAEYSTTLIVGTDSLGLSTQWTDNKTVTSPSQTIKRVITPGIRQKNIVPKTSLKKVGVTVKESHKVPFSKAKNVSKISSKTAPSHQWVGSGGNLKAPTIVEKKVPAAALQKMVNKYGR
jgi:phage protein D